MGASDPVPVSPVKAVLLRRGPLMAGVTAELECVAWGARPQAEIRWSLGGRPMPSAFVHWDGNVSTATVSLLPRSAHNGQKLVCSASNPDIPDASPVQDSRLLDVRCE